MAGIDLQQPKNKRSNAVFNLKPRSRRILERKAKGAERLRQAKLDLRAVYKTLVRYWSREVRRSAELPFDDANGTPKDVQLANALNK